MELIILILVPFILIVLEVYYDTLVNKSKRSTDHKKRRKYSQRYHALQMVIFAFLISIGFYLAYLILINKVSWWLLLAASLNYIALRLWLFNSIYNTVNDLAKNYTSNLELYDRLYNRLVKWIINKFSIRHIGLLTMILNIIKAALYFLSIIYLYNKL